MRPALQGSLPITAEMLLTQPSGNLFGLTQNAGMGWEPARLLDPEFLILSTHGGMRAQDGTPIALGFHSGHWEVGLLVAEAARELRNLHAFAVCRGVHRPMRRPDSGNRGHAGLASLSQRRCNRAATADAFAADTPRRDGRGDLRQGPARDDDGACVVRRVSEHPGARRRDSAAG